MSDLLTSLQRQVLEYLRQNPHAAETAEGINRMWLGRSSASAEIVEVERVLAGLVARSLLEECALPGGTKVYRAYRRECE
jgi:Fe2+ or Zn2+ uptake regulation protein